MKKTRKYAVVNTQEDEDGYTLYATRSIALQNAKQKPSPKYTVNVQAKKPNPAVNLASRP